MSGVPCQAGPVGKSAAYEDTAFLQVGHCCIGSKSYWKKIVTDPIIEPNTTKNACTTTGECFLLVFSKDVFLMDYYPKGSHGP